MPPRLARVRRLLVWLLLPVAVAYVVWDRIEAWRSSSDVAAITARAEPAHDDEAFPRPSAAGQSEAAELYARAAGAAQTKHVGPQSPRDFGIRVPLKPSGD